MWAQWPMGGAWLCLHLAEHWRFGRDRRFLADALPIAVARPASSSICWPRTRTARW